jgi:hypothetical protein
MKNESIIIDKDQAVPVDSKVIEKKLVELQRSWIFWENYQIDVQSHQNNENKDWNAQIKRVFNFSDLITFWQFWNTYPGSIPKDVFYNGDRFIYFFDTRKRIDGLNLFVEGISPKWEDPENAGGKILALQYDIRDDLEGFLDYASHYWRQLILELIGETLPCANLVRNIFNIKFKFNKTILFIPYCT